MTPTLTLHVIRHGEVYNPEKVLYGRLPNFRLSDTGKAQAQATATALANVPLQALYASPLQRAQETARAILAHHPNLAIQTEEGLNEVLTPYQGRTSAEIDILGWDKLYDKNLPPYETVATLRHRVLSCVQSFRERHQHQTIASVTHGDVVVSLFAHACGLPEDDLGKERLLELGFPVAYPATASILTLTYTTHQVDERPHWAYTRPY